MKTERELFEEFKQWWFTAKHTLKCDQYDAYEIWQASKASVTDVNIPDGWVVVPREPTERMIKSALEAGSGFLYRKIYKAMIEAVENNL